MERRKEQNIQEIVGVYLVKQRSWQNNSFVLSKLSSQLRSGTNLFLLSTRIASCNYEYLGIYTIKS
jgi:hypothetical protein